MNYYIKCSKCPLSTTHVCSRLW